MSAYADKTQKRNNLSVANPDIQKQSISESTLKFVDKRPVAITQRKMQEMAYNSPQASQLRAVQAMADNYTAQQSQPFQKKENNTGLPDILKTGIENLSGYAMDDVKVHYSSDKPAQLQAHAYAQGTDIHLGPGQEKHLPHEAWHVVQQKQGRVKPTVQLKADVNINDDESLEKEADVMGTKAMQFVDTNTDIPLQKKQQEVIRNHRQTNKTTRTSLSPIQRLKVNRKTSDKIKAAAKRCGFDEEDPALLACWKGASSEEQFKEWTQNADAFDRYENQDAGPSEPVVIPDFVEPSEEDLWDKVVNSIADELPGIKAERVPGIEKREMIAIQLEIDRETYYIGHNDNAKARRTEKNTKKRELNELIIAFGAHAKHLDDEKEKDDEFQVDKDALKALPAVQGNAQVSDSVDRIQRVGETRTMTLDGTFTAAELLAACNAWNSIEDQGIITNFHVPGQTTQIKAKQRGDVIDVNKVLACKVNNIDVFVHLYADDALAQRARAAGIDVAIPL